MTLQQKLENLDKSYAKIEAAVAHATAVRTAKTKISKTIKDALQIVSNNPNPCAAISKRLAS